MKLNTPLKSKSILSFICLLCLLITPFYNLVAQKAYTGKRLIIGAVVDSIQQRVIEEATITYIAKNDTIQGVNAAFGFNILGVPYSEFRLIIKSLGYKTRVLNFHFNHEPANINLGPINLKKSPIDLDEVLVTSSKTPQVNGDTTSFWAENYYIRDYDSLKELVKQLEGVSIDDNGNLTYNGKAVTKALLNGHSYFQGSIKEALQQIPVSVINKIQFIGKNEDGSGRKTLQTEESSTVMNVVTKKDKSAARMFDISTLASTVNHKKVEGFFRTINGAESSSYNFGYEL